MMAWIPKLGDPTELGTHQNYCLSRIFKQLDIGRRWLTMLLRWGYSQLVSLEMELFTACQAAAKEPPINLSAVDPSPFMPPPMGIRSVLKM
jgi:hypothetical protein